MKVIAAGIQVDELEAVVDAQRRGHGLAGEGADVDHQVEDGEGAGPVGGIGAFGGGAGYDRFDDGPADGDEKEGGDSGLFELKQSQQGVADCQEDEGHSQGSSKAELVGHGSHERRQEIENGRERARRCNGRRYRKKPIRRLR